MLKPENILFHCGKPCSLSFRLFEAKLGPVHLELSRLYYIYKAGQLKSKPPTRWSLIGRSMTAPPPVLSPSIIVPPLPSHWAFTAGRNNSARVEKCHFSVCFFDCVTGNCVSRGLAVITNSFTFSLLTLDNRRSTPVHILRPALHDYVLVSMAQHPLVGQSLLIEASRSHSHTPQLVEILWTSDQPDADTSDNTHHSQVTNIHAPGGFRTRNPSKLWAADPRLRPRSHWDQHINYIITQFFLRSVLFWCFSDRAS
jgi:hypothetical protein